MRIKFYLFSLLLILSSPMMASHPGSPTENPFADLVMEVSVYPNPSSGIFFVKIESDAQQDLQVSLVNLIGQTIETKQVETNSEIRFDLNNKPKGYYFIKIKAGNQEMIKRISIQ